MPPYRMGKKPRRVDFRTLRFSRYLGITLAPPPESVSWQQKAPGQGWGMLGNDTLGDCVVAAAGHQIDCWEDNADPAAPTYVTQDQAVALYDQLSPQDDGLVILDFLNGWRKGYPLGGRTDSLFAYASVDPQNTTQVKDAVSLLGGCFLGLLLPDFVVQAPDPTAVDWVGRPGIPGNPANGHAVVILGYDADWFYILTWGKVVRMDASFLASYCDEAYALLSTDWLNSTTGQTPDGLDLTQLQWDLAGITSAPPGPTPPPPPSDPCMAMVKRAEELLGQGQIEEGLGALVDAIACYFRAGKAAKHGLESAYDYVKRKI